MEKTKQKHVGALLYPGCVALDLAGPLEAFNYVSLLGTEEGNRQNFGYKITLLAPTMDPVKTMSGIQFCPDTTFQQFNEPLDVLLIPGMKAGDNSYKEPSVTQWLNQQAQHTERLASVCSGAYVLANAGLLDGHKVTTHWNHGDKLQAAYPSVEVDAHKIHCRSGNIYSSAGVTAGIDLALAIIEEDYGKSLALKVAKRMVVFLKRPGDQAQFSDILNAQSNTSRFSKLLDWIEANLTQNITIETMAEECAMSPRNFSRAFSADIGLPPSQYIRNRRLERARLLLEDTDQTVASVAQKAGFSTTEQLQRAFREVWRVSPKEYRQRFQ